MISGHCRQSDRARDSATVHCDVRLLMSTRAERTCALSTLSRPQGSDIACKPAGPQADGREEVPADWDKVRSRPEAHLDGFLSGRRLNRRSSDCPACLQEQRAAGRTHSELC